MTRRRCNPEQASVGPIGDSPRRATAAQIITGSRDRADGELERSGLAAGPVGGRREGDPRACGAFRRRHTGNSTTGTPRSAMRDERDADGRRERSVRRGAGSPASPDFAPLRLPRGRRFLARIFHPAAADSAKPRAMPTASHPPRAEQVGWKGCAVFDGRFAPGSGLLSSPRVTAIGVVGCAGSRAQTATPNSRAPVKHPG